MDDEQFQELMQGLAFLSIQVTRLYDVMLASIDGKQQYDLLKLHADGGTNSPAPVLSENLWQE